MRIAIAAAEVAPFAKIGGLGDVAAALCRHLARRGHDVRLFMPLYGRIDRAAHEILPVDFLTGITLEVGRHRLVFDGYTTRLPGSDLWIYLLDCPRLFGRKSVYTSEPDEPLRFVSFSGAVFEVCQRMGWAPDILHANDWHTALMPLLKDELYGWDRLFERCRTVLTIHNLAHQGVFAADLLGEVGLAGAAGRFHQGHLAAGHVNLLETGILHADLLTTVSPTYAREIQTPELGMGLDRLLAARSSRLVGILNGVDYGEWNPATDPWLRAHYSPDDMAGKAVNRSALLAELHLAPDAAAPVYGVVSRLVAQKGFELCFEPLPELLRLEDARLLVLGSGEGRFEQLFTRLQEDHPGKVCYYRGFNEELAHRIEAAADVFLMPSRFEPCGLNQMYSLKYGTVPLVRKTGGLADSVEPFDAASGRGTGIVFEHFDSAGLGWALARSLELYRDAAAWERLRANGMSRDFSWERQVVEYEELYRKLVARG